MRSIRTYLNALVLAVLVPLLALATVLAVNYARSQRHVIEAERTDVINNLAFLVDREIDAIESSLRVLAISPVLKGGQFDLFNQHAGAAFDQGAAIVLSRPDGTFAITSGNRANAPERYDANDHFRTVFGGNSHISGLRTDATGKPIDFMVSVPVFVDRKVAYALTAEVNLDRLQPLFNEAGLRPHWIGTIVDADGRILARSAAAEQFVGSLARNESVDAARGARESGGFDNSSMEGVQTSNIFRRSQSTGWTLFVAVPTRILHAPISDAYKFMAIVGTALTALGLGLAYLLADRINSGAKHLTSAALDVVSGHDVAPVQYRVSEFSQVAKVFEYASSIAAERKLDEQRLIESDERQRLALDAAAFATWDVDVGSGCAVWSPRLYAFLGYDQDKAGPPTVAMWLDRLHPDDKARVIAESARARDAHEPDVAEYRIIRADTGEVRWLRSNGKFHYDEDGNARRLVGVIRDITDRKLMELSLRESEMQYRSALTVGRMGSWETNFLTRERRWTPEAQALFGLSLPDGLGSVGGNNDEFFGALHPDDRAAYEKLHKLAHTMDQFTTEYRIVRPGGEVVWLAGRGQVMARANDGTCARLVSVMADVTEQKNAEQRVRFLLREMSHRSKNLLAVIQSLASQTMRSSSSMADFQSHFERRLQGLAASHDILVDQNWQGATLANLVRKQLEPFADPDSDRIVIDGPAVDLNAAAAQTVGLALHELATNAVKYGSLSVPAGKITVRWSREPDNPQCIALDWTETGGPPASPPTRKGFGHAVIERMAPASIGGRVALEYLPTGLHWRLIIPTSALSAGDALQSHGAGPSPDDIAPATTRVNGASTAV